MKSLLISILIVFISVNGFSQQTKFHRNLDSLFFVSKIDSLKLRHIDFKIVPTDLELQVLTTLTYFPELDSVQIKFKSARIKTTLNCRPTVLSALFCSSKNRKYIVRVNSKIADSVINFQNIPFNAQIGLIGHEFCHILDYQSKSRWNLLKTMFYYFHITYKSTYEKSVDLMTIQKGLGWQLYDWMYFVENGSHVFSNYLNYKRKVYLNSQVIKELIYADGRY